MRSTTRLLAWVLRRNRTTAMTASSTPALIVVMRNPLPHALVAARSSGLCAVAGHQCSGLRMWAAAGR
ncbi:hypothetical protein [Streptomyces sp. bgisy060]|uniref:hypothetical protein n=1 Tax=Streptomyces sp. bgisy060 TaxID=3413775 RepID=UPI003EB9508B